MRNRTQGAYLLLAIVAASSGCTSQAVYAPSAHSDEVARHCPMGRVLVCRDRYDAAVAGEEDPEEEFCMCQDLGKVR